ncbi:MAG: HAMP domain-containing protein [Deltaproteobacteria bacterium]|jgi:two-component system nitrogen regulation sensor histidine kinase NtrY|nr:HAMP domain-containing protein [Deltaproteobacteria bacterium]
MTDKTQNIRKRRTRYAIIICLILIPILTYLETVVFQIGEVTFPVSGNVLVFSLININIILLLLMAFLVFRNLVRFIFEQRQISLNKSLRTRLVVSIISLSLVPTILLFFIALQFVSTSMDYWFNSNVEASLDESLQVAQDIYQEKRKVTIETGKAIAEQLIALRLLDRDSAAILHHLEGLLAARNLEGLSLFSDQRQVVAEVVGENINNGDLPEIPAELFRLAQTGKTGQTTIQPVATGEIVRSAIPVYLKEGNQASPYILVTTEYIPQEQLRRMTVISKGIDGYRQLMMLKNPLKTSLLVMLLIVTLLIIFSAIWFGIYIARSLTGPIGKLADATRRVAEGELDFVLEKDSDDEMGLLVDSFNRMTSDLQASKKQLESVNVALQQSNIELDERRSYIETILQNVPAGVISFDAAGNVTSINKFAEDLLHIDKAHYLHQDFRKTLMPNHVDIIEKFLQELEESGKSTIQSPLRLFLGKERFSLLVNITKLYDEAGNSIGTVLVFDNLTQLEKAQRIAAWREVARRIAHEVKNPLTPIQLSAQRLRKRYLYTLETDQEVFDVCTQTIINQVEELKRLVSEFSSFARMPIVQKSPNDLVEMVKEILVFYEESHPYITFRQKEEQNIPRFNFDLKQMKRVLINLVENSISVLHEGGVIEIVLSCDSEKQVVLLEVKDNGPGVADEDKHRLFEPYFSTKKSGTGLGLAIASTVVADHGGQIRVTDNSPTGAIFTVELPMTA